MRSADIYKRYINKDADENALYKVARIGVLPIGLVSVIFALVKPTALADLLVLSAAGVGVIVPAVVGSLYWGRSTEAAAVASIAVDEAVMVYMTFIHTMSLCGMSAGFVSMMLSFVIFIGVGLATKPRTTRSRSWTLSRSSSP